jgi:hypothetical protein
MSGHGNGKGNGNGTGNGNGIGEKTWNLAENGMLWKTALVYATKDFEEQAKTFVAQLQESVQPADALQGLLLDRIAAGYLRKRLMLEGEAAGRENVMENKLHERSGYPEGKRRIALALSQHLWFRNGDILRYEGLLDQAFHRDLILLQQLKKAAAAARVVSAQTSPESNRGLIEGEVEHPDVG